MHRRAVRGGMRGRAGNASPWLPSRLSGLVAWYRADKGVTIGTGVSAWADQSGTGDANKNLAQATAAKQPTLNASDAAYNGRPTLSFAVASIQSLRSTAWASAPIAARTIVTVGNFASSSQTFCDGLNLNESLVDNGGGGGPNQLRIYAGASLAYGGAFYTPQIGIGVFNGASSVIYTNAKTQAASGNAGASTLSGLTVGTAGDSTTSPLGGKMAEVIVYSRALSASEVAQVLTYCGARYAISIGA